MQSTKKIFCCYARKDQKLLDELKTYLIPMQREGLITLWADTDIDAGKEWEREIKMHLNAADIILLLVSPDFMTSEYCYSIEMQRAMERHEQREAKVIPIILSPVHWQQAPFGKLQVLPKDGKPITGSAWVTKGKALFSVADGIRKVVLVGQLATKSKNGNHENNKEKENEKFQKKLEANRDKIVSGNSSTTLPNVPQLATSITSPAAIQRIVFQEDGSNGWQDWVFTSDWRTVDNNKLLINDGSKGSNQEGPSAIPPYSLPQGIQNFAIEVGITVPQIRSQTHFSIIACGSTTESGWQGYEGLMAFDSRATTAQIFVSHEEMARIRFDPGTGLHIYRLNIRGNVIAMLIDNALIAQATDNKFLPYGNQVGIVSSLAVIHVNSFKVILL